jgi:hypothetical protein
MLNLNDSLLGNVLERWDSAQCRSQEFCMKSTNLVQILRALHIKVFGVLDGQDNQHLQPHLQHPQLRERLYSRGALPQSGHPMLNVSSR